MSDRNTKAQEPAVRELADRIGTLEQQRVRERESFRADAWREGAEAMRAACVNLCVEYEEIDEDTPEEEGHKEFRIKYGTVELFEAMMRIPNWPLPVPGTAQPAAEQQPTTVSGTQWQNELARQIHAWATINNKFMEQWSDDSVVAFVKWRDERKSAATRGSVPVEEVIGLRDKLREKARILSGESLPQQASGMTMEGIADMLDDMLAAHNPASPEESK